MCKKIAIDNSPEPLPKYLVWGNATKKHAYTVRSNGSFMQTRIDHCDSLTEARKLSIRIIQSGKSEWAEVLRWAQNGTMLKSIFICSYELDEGDEE